MSAFTEGFLRGLSQFYAGAAAGKNLLFDSGFLDHCKLKTPVISIGNLTMGGTGKTPMCLWIAREASLAGKKVCIVARGYGSRFSHPRRVNLSEKNPVELYGDEAVQMQSALPGVFVVVGNPKWRAALWAEQQFQADLILLDDGFQHRSLFRNLDLVLIDASQDVMELEPLPLGKARESLESLVRADLVLLTKINSAKPEVLENYKNLLSPYKVKLVEYHSVLDEIPATSQIILASGIGNFKALRSQVVGILGEARVKECFQFPDHHGFSKADAQRLLNSMVSHQAEKIVVTEKDFVKLQAFPELVNHLAVIRLHLKWLQKPEEIYEVIHPRSL
jgi:tetraacyldisaccharide 4'-kinase